jgi:hypothetical protein
VTGRPMAGAASRAPALAIGMAALLVSAGLLGSPRPALAQSGSGDVGGEGDTNYAGVEVTVRGGGGNGGGGGGGGGVSCDWGERVPSELLDNYEAYSSETWTLWDGKVHTGGWFPVSCNNGYADTVFVPDDMPAPLILPMEEIVGYARSLIQPIPIEIGMNPVGRQVVKVPTWLYINENAFTTMEATATVTPPIGGSLSATVTAAPDEVRWTTGDGSAPVVCDGPGEPFSGPDPMAEGDCSHTYKRAGEGFSIEATLNWTVSWTATNGEGDVLPDLFSSDTASTSVVEVQSINRG